MKQTLLLSFALLVSVIGFSQCNELFISEYVHAGGNSRALEIYNPSQNPIDLSQYQLVRYSNGENIPNKADFAPAGKMLDTGDVWVVVSDKRDPNGTGYDTMVDPALQLYADTFICPSYGANKMMYFNGNDAVTLEKGNGVYVDIIGKIGQDPGEAWTADAANGYTSAGGARWWTKRNTLIRKKAVDKGVTSNPPLVFNPTVEWDSLGSHTYNHLGYHNCNCIVDGFESINKKTNDCFFFPNPSTNGWFMVKGTEVISRVEVLNVTGQIVISKQNPVERGDIKISTDGLQKGIYMVNVYFSDKTSITKKIILN